MVKSLKEKIEWLLVQQYTLDLVIGICLDEAQKHTT